MPKPTHWWNGQRWVLPWSFSLSGGSLIVVNWVLTAAHCVYEFLDPRSRRKKWYLVTCFFYIVWNIENVFLRMQFATHHFYIISALVLVCFSSLLSSYRLIRQSSLHLALLFCKTENLPDNAYNVKKQNKTKQTRCLISFH